MKTWNTPRAPGIKLLGLSILGHGAKEDKRKLAEVAQNGGSSYASHCMGQCTSLWKMIGLKESNRDGRNATDSPIQWSVPKRGGEHYILTKCIIVSRKGGTHHRGAGSIWSGLRIGPASTQQQTPAEPGLEGSTPGVVVMKPNLATSDRHLVWN
jgi:hypothetical protein